MKIFCPSQTRLGDNLIAASNLARFVAKRKVPVIFAPHPKIFSWSAKLQARCLETFLFAAECFRSPLIKISIEPATEFSTIRRLPETGLHNFSALKQREREKVIVYDFNPRTKPNRFTQVDGEKLLSLFSSEFLLVDLHELANSKGLDAVHEVFQKACLFLGADSGFAHLAHAYNVHSLLFRNKAHAGRLERWHKGSHYEVFNSVDEFVKSPGLTYSPEELDTCIARSLNPVKTRKTIALEFLNRSQNGEFLEFGVAEGKSINRMAELAPDRQFHGFDSFEGLPENWTRSCPKGRGACDFNSLSWRPNVKIYKGLFSDTLPNFQVPKLAGIHIDCDLGSSTNTVFNQLETQILRDKPLLLFDEFYRYSSYRQHEFGEFLSFVNRHQLLFQVLSTNIRHQQVLIKLL